MTKCSGVQHLFLKRVRIKSSRQGAQKQPAARRHVPSGRPPAKEHFADEPAAEVDDSATAALRQYIVQKYALGNWYATDVAELCHYLTNCGLPFKAWSLNPTGLNFAANASRKVRASFRMDDVEKTFTSIQLPQCHTESGERVFEDIQCLIFADILSQEFKARPQEILAQQFSSSTWASHPDRLAGEAAGDICIAFGLFIDGAAWKGKGAGTRESVLATYVNVLGESGP